MIHILYENPDWLPPLTGALDRRGLLWNAIFCGDGSFPIFEAPPTGIYVNRMSPSAHTRGNGAGIAFVREYLPFLEQHGRRVINGSRSFGLEVSKVRQHTLLEALGIRTPRTIAVAGTAGLKAAARSVGLPLITKHNQGGKGLGVRLFEDFAAFDAYVDGPDFESAFDGVTLIQAYIRPKEAYITRVEIVDGRFLYALRASTAGGFELCPADACDVPVAAGDAFCPVGATGKFGASPIGADDPLVQDYLRLCAIERIDAAGIEFVEDAEGNRYTYDINMNTNYNSEVEGAVGIAGMDAWAGLCARLSRESTRQADARRAEARP